MKFSVWEGWFYACVFWKRPRLLFCEVRSTGWTYKNTSAGFGLHQVLQVLADFGIDKNLGLLYGAIDMILTPSGEYVFLEVNESGQFL